MAQLQPLPEELAKWRKIERSCDEDYLLPLMQYQGHMIARLCGGNARRIAEVAMSCARDCIAYQSDIAQFGAENLDEPQNVWRRGIDDCDGKARLFVALVRAAHDDGARWAEPVPGWTPDEKRHGLWLSHVSAKALVDGMWLPVELTLKRARLGEKPDEVPREITDGRWLR